MKRPLLLALLMAAGAYLLYLPIKVPLNLYDEGNPHEPNGSALSSGVTHLDEYLRSRYTFHKQFGNYQLWQRQNQP